MSSHSASAALLIACLAANASPSAAFSGAGAAAFPRAGRAAAIGRPSTGRVPHAARAGGLRMVQTPGRTSMSDLSKMGSDMREQMDQDERVKVLMEGMRGRSLNDDDFAAAGTDFQVEFRTCTCIVGEGQGSPPALDLGGRGRGYGVSCIPRDLTPNPSLHEGGGI